MARAPGRCAPGTSAGPGAGRSRAAPKKTSGKVPLAIVSTPLPAPCSTANRAATGAPKSTSRAAPTGCIAAARRADSSGWTRRSKPNSSSRPATCAGPTSAPTAIAPRQRHAALLEQPGQVRGHRRADEPGDREDECEQAGGMARRHGGALVGQRRVGRRARRRARRRDLGSNAFSGTPSTRWSAAQVKQAPRQPMCVSRKAESGQPTVLAKPAISVMPVIAPRASRPYSRTSAAKPAS